MDPTTLAIAIALMKALPGTATADAVAAADRAEAAAESASKHAMGVTIEGTNIIFSYDD